MTIVNSGQTSRLCSTCPIPAVLPLSAPQILCWGCRKIWGELPEDKRERLYFFNSFFWTKLSEKAPQGNQSRAQKADASFQRVKRWTRVRFLPDLMRLIVSKELCEVTRHGRDMLVTRLTVISLEISSLDCVLVQL